MLTQRSLICNTVPNECDHSFGSETRFAEKSDNWLCHHWTHFCHWVSHNSRKFVEAPIIVSTICMRCSFMISTIFPPSRGHDERGCSCDDTFESIGNITMRSSLNQPPLQAWISSLSRTKTFSKPSPKSSPSDYPQVGHKMIHPRCGSMIIHIV